MSVNRDKKQAFLDAVAAGAIERGVTGEMIRYQKLLIAATTREDKQAVADGFKPRHRAKTAQVVVRAHTFVDHIPDHISAADAVAGFMAFVYDNGDRPDWMPVGRKEL